MIHTQYLSFMGSNRILSLIIFLTNMGHYDILIGNIRYFDLIKLTEKGMYSSTITMVISISLFMSFESLTLDKPK